MMSVNIDQADFYDEISNRQVVSDNSGYYNNRLANFATTIWARIRASNQSAYKLLGVDKQKNDFFEKWMNKKKGGSVLEIGCFDGSAISMTAIKYAGSYKGLDLSKNAIDKMNQNIKKDKLDKKATAIAVDFLTYNDKSKVDLVLAHGCLHHFQFPSLLFEKISNHLKDDGIFVFAEPSSCNFFLRSIRLIYRPFQSDRHWEWPFTKKTVDELQTRFEIIEGFGWGKWSIFLSLFTKIPFLNLIFSPFFLRLVRAEMNENFSNRSWMNSTVVISCKKSKYHRSTKTV